MNRRILSFTMKGTNAMEFPRKHVEPNVFMNETERRTRAWVNEFLPHDSRSKALEAEPWRYASLTMPAASPGIVNLCSDYFAWLVAFDDDVAERAGPVEILESLYSFSSDEHDFNDDFSEAIADIVHRGCEFKSRDAWSRMFRLAICDYVAGCAQEMRFRRCGKIPSQIAYRSFRHQTIGMMPIFSIAALQLCSNGLAWFDEVCSAHSTCVQASYCCAWANDYHSHVRGRGAGEDLFNVVSVFMNEQHWDAMHARDRLASIFNIERMMLDDELEHVGELGRLIAQIIDGNTEWYATSRRYASASMK